VSLARTRIECPIETAGSVNVERVSSAFEVSPGVDNVSELIESLSSGVTSSTFDQSGAVVHDAAAASATGRPFCDGVRSGSI